MPSATMALLKGGKKGAAVPDETDTELAGAAAEATDGEAEAEAAGVAIPTTKTEVHALKIGDLPAVHAAMGNPIEGFDKLDLKGKKSAIMNHLFPAKGAAKAGLAGDDALAVIANEIENMKTRTEIEKALALIASAEGENFFRRGGLLVKLSELGDFGEYANFADYVKGEGIAPEYRTARYWMKIYTGLLEAGIPYAQVQGVGWTKIVTMIDVLTKDNVDEWIAKAKVMNVPTLKAEVDAAIAGSGAPGSGSDSPGASSVKSMVFKVHKDQEDTINDALAKSKKANTTESKEVALDYICIEYLGNASSKPQKAAEPIEVKVGYDVDNLDVEAFFAAIKAKYPSQNEAMAFLFSGPENQPDGKEDSYFELAWPTVNVSIDVPAEAAED